MLHSSAPKSSLVEAVEDKVGVLAGGLVCLL